MKSKFSFWQLLGDYTVVIPMIQRDYAQGRQDARTKQIRESFLDDLLAALAGEQGSINLDFVYGSDHSKRLVLLDGQQRLTTLFLLHWILAFLCPQEASFAADRLKKFTYETRTTTRDFCEALMTRLRKGGVSWSEDQEVSAWIEDASWFPRSWKQDPSIAGMLIMLDALQNRFVNADSERLWSRLTNDNNPAITFQFLNMEEFRLTDELYVKMNARGRALSDFENFKAWLQLYVERNQFVLALDDWAEALDVRWTDLFWKHRQTGINEIDEAYLNFFNGQALSTFAASRNRNISKEKLEESDVRNIQALNDNKYFGAVEREALDAYTVDALNRCFAVLEALCRLKETVGIYLPLFTQPQNYGERVRAHTIGVFLVQPSINGAAPVLGSIEFDHWLRVVGNLIQNTTIDSPLAFVRAVRAVDSMASTLLSASETCDTLYSRVAALNPSDIDFFAKAQREEEVTKCKLICSDQAWENLLLEAEDHLYLAGQVGFLIDLSTPEAGQPDKGTFKRIWTLASLLFADGIRNHDKYLLQRALLVYGDYTFYLGSNHNLCRAAAKTLRDREENWRRVFRNPQGCRVLKLMCDDLLQRLDAAPTMAEVVDQLESIIIGMAPSPPCNFNDWRWTLIKGESLLKKCEYLQIRRTEDAPGNGYTRTYLLAGLRMSGPHAELMTFDLWLNCLRKQVDDLKLLPFINGDYHWASGGTEEPFVYLKGWNFAECDITLRIYNQGDQFAIHLRAWDEGQELPTTLRQKLVTDLDFSLTADGFGAVVRLVPMAEIDNQLCEITAALRFD